MIKLRCIYRLRRNSVFTILFAFQSLVANIYSQESYKTLQGTIVISTEIENEPVKFVSNNLDVWLNYETAEFKFVLSKTNLRTDKIEHLNLFKPDRIYFNGKLGIEYIKTDSHPTQIFGVEGILSSSLDQEFALRANGSLSHLYSNTRMACWLSINMILEMHQVKGFVLDSATTDDMIIEVSNTVLDEN
jgi:hypothetical protein